MKGKMELRFIAPNVSKVRTRVENPTPELTSQIRQFLNEAVVEVAENSQYEIKAKVLKKIAALETSGKIKFNNPQHRAQVFDVTSDIFNTAFTVTAEELEARFPEAKAPKKEAKDKKEDAGTEEAPAENAETADAQGEAAEAEAGDAAPAEQSSDEFDD